MSKKKRKAGEPLTLPYFTSLINGWDAEGIPKASGSLATLMPNKDGELAVVNFLGLPSAGVTFCVREKEQLVEVKFHFKSFYDRSPANPYSELIDYLNRFDELSVDSDYRLAVMLRPNPSADITLIEDTADITFTADCLHSWIDSGNNSFYRSIYRQLDSIKREIQSIRDENSESVTGLDNLQRMIDETLLSAEKPERGKTYTVHLFFNSTDEYGTQRAFFEMVPVDVDSSLAELEYERNLQEMEQHYGVGTETNEPASIAEAMSINTSTEKEEGWEDEEKNPQAEKQTMVSISNAGLYD